MTAGVPCRSAASRRSADRPDQRDAPRRAASRRAASHRRRSSRSSTTDARSPSARGQTRPRLARRASRASAAIIRQTGIVGRRPGRPGRARASRPRAASVTLSGRIARASGSRRIRAMRSARPTIEPRLRPADELVAAERDEVGAGRQALGRRRLVGQAEAPSCRAAPRDPRSSTTIAPCRWASSASAAGSGASTKPACAKFDGWTRRTAGARPSASGASKSDGARPVRRPDLDEPRAGPPDDLRDPHAAADLDELAARDDDAAPAGQPDRERQGRRVVVRDERVLGAGQRDRGGPRPSGTGRRGARSSRSNSSSEIGRGSRVAALDRDLRRPRRPTEVRVEDDAGRVDDRGRAAPRVAKASRRATASSARASTGRGVVAGGEPRAFVVDHDPRDAASAVGIAPAVAVAAHGPRPGRARRSGVAVARSARTSSGLRGGNAWESNPPRRAERRATGFEDQGTHRDPTAPVAMVAAGSSGRARLAPIIGDDDARSPRRARSASPS